MLTIALKLILARHMLTAPVTALGCGVGLVGAAPLDNVAPQSEERGERAGRVREGAKEAMSGL